MSALDLVLSYLTQPFIQRAFVIGILVALLSSLLSVFIVLKNVSLIGDGLAHTAFGGLAVGYYVGFFPLWTAATNRNWFVLARRMLPNSRLSRLMPNPRPNS